jgi:hypothetical protein
MSSILWTWFKYFCLYCANFFSAGTTFSSFKISSFLLWSNELYPCHGLLVCRCVVGYQCFWEPCCLHLHTGDVCGRILAFCRTMLPSSSQPIGPRFESSLLWKPQVSKLYPAVDLTNYTSAVFCFLISLCFNVCISQPCKSNGIAKILHTLSTEIACGLNLVSKHCSRFPKFVRT